MGGSTSAPAEPNFSKQDLQTSYACLLNDLNEAYWAAGDLNAKDQIYGCIEAITKILVALDAADLESRDAAYTTLSQEVADVNKRLEGLKEQIDHLISRINTIGTIVADITKVLTVAAKVMPAM